MSRSQSVDGIEEANILEIIDHHRIGSVETIGPVFFRNQPVGCTATIIYQMYREYGVEIPKLIASLLCSAIISDTLMFRSPTCTLVDKEAAEALAKIADIHIEELAKSMFNAGSNLKGKTAEEICFLDFKKFTVNNTTFGVGQVNSMSEEELEHIREKVLPELPKAMEKQNLDMIYFMLTNIVEESSELLCFGHRAKEQLLEAFDLSQSSGYVILKGVVSRKKQLVPTIVSALQQ